MIYKDNFNNISFYHVKIKMKLLYFGMIIYSIYNKVIYSSMKMGMFINLEQSILEMC